MAIPLLDEDSLGRLIEELRWEVVSANAYHAMRASLIAASDEYSAEMAVGNAFWGSVVMSAVDSTTFRMIRLYDPKKTHLGLPGLLDTIRANPHLMTNEKLVRRIGLDPLPINRTFATSAKYMAPMDWKQLERDIQSVSEKNPTVQQLLEARNHRLAHIDGADVAAPQRSLGKYWLKDALINELIQLACEIVDRYSRLYNWGHCSRNFVGYDDFKAILEAIRAAQLPKPNASS